jgi:hypothetical protein
MNPGRADPWGGDRSEAIIWKHVGVDSLDLSQLLAEELYRD